MQLLTSRCQPVGRVHAGSLFSSRFSYVDTNDGAIGIRATAAGPDDGRTALYQCTVSISVEHLLCLSSTSSASTALIDVILDSNHLGSHVQKSSQIRSSQSLAACSCRSGHQAALYGRRHPRKDQPLRPHWHPLKHLQQGQLQHRHRGQLWHPHLDRCQHPRRGP